jgi:hypothetical protein
MTGPGQTDGKGPLYFLGARARARVTQIMDLTLLAPDTQETILFLPPIAKGTDPITALHLREVGHSAKWADQRKAWAVLARAA